LETGLLLLYFISEYAVRALRKLELAGVFVIFVDDKNDTVVDKSGRAVIISEDANVRVYVNTSKENKNWK